MESYATVLGSHTVAQPQPIDRQWRSADELLREYPVHTIGNYFMLTTGQILTDVDGATKVWSVDDLAWRMLAANISFPLYAEGITRGYVRR